MAGLKKTLRINRLIQVLMSREHYLTGPELARRFGVTERTIRRDIAELSELDIGIYNDDRGYKIYSDRHMQIPYSLTRDEWSLLNRMIQTSAYAGIKDVKKRSEQLMAKLKSLSKTDSQPVEGDSVKLGDVMSPDRVTISLGDLESSIRDSRRCVILYQGLLDAEPAQRLIDPYAVVIRAGMWYLIAFDRARDDYRTFRIDRIKGLKPSAERFKRLSSFSIEDYFKDSWGVFRGKPMKVQVELKGIAARLAAEREWPEERSLKWTAEDTAVLSATVCGEDEIASWVLSFGPDAHVIKPKRLRDRVKQSLSRSLERYDD